MTLPVPWPLYTLRLPLYSAYKFNDDFDGWLAHFVGFEGNEERRGVKLGKQSRKFSEGLRRKRYPGPGISVSFLLHLGINGHHSSRTSLTQHRPTKQIGHACMVVGRRNESKTETRRTLFLIIFHYNIFTYN